MRSGWFGWLGRASGAGMTALLLLCALLAEAPGQPKSSKQGEAPTRESAARIQRETQILQSRFELATSDTFYLELDPARSTLDLRFKGALLQQYHLIAMEVGIPRVLFRPRTLPPEWQGRVWQRGNLHPPRLKQRSELRITTLGDTAYADSVTRSFGIPRTPEELYPVPHRYLVRYEGGLSLEVRLPADADSLKPHQSFGRTLRTWWDDLVGAVRPSLGDRVRVRIVLSIEEAKSLYRALPPDTRLLVIPAHEPFGSARSEEGEDGTTD